MPEQQKRKKREQKKEKIQRERKKEFRKPIVEEEIEIVRVVEEKEKGEEDLIEIRMVEKIVSRMFYKYLKIFEKKELEKIQMRKLQNHTIDLREEFVSKKRKIYLLSRIEREKVQKFLRNQLRKEYIQLLKLL